MPFQEDGKPRKMFYIDMLLDQLKQTKHYDGECRHLLKQQLTQVRMAMFRFSAGLEVPLEPCDIDGALSSIAEMCRQDIKRLVDDRMQERMCEIVDEWEARMRHIEGLPQAVSP